MAFDLVETALSSIEAYGLIAIFILLVLDGAMLLPVFPGEIVLILAVSTYATDPSGLIMLIVLTSVAGLVGSLILYGLMRGGGRRLVEKFPGFFGMPKKRREKLEEAFRKPLGQSMVLFLRVVPLTRVLVNIPAGLAKMPVVRFVVLSSIGLVAYHAGFLWFSYEVRRPGSELQTQTEALTAAYASPAWEYVQANAIVAGLAVLLLGAVLSVRASRKMAKDPESGAGGLLGNLANITLFWGGIALAVMLYMDPEAVYEVIALGGLDVHAMAAWVGVSSVIFVGLVAGVSIGGGVLLFRLRMKARARRKRKRHPKNPFPWLEPPPAKLTPEQRFNLAARPVVRGHEFEEDTEPELDFEEDEDPTRA